ncbi:MAG: TonB-dependent receptor, partial [Myxococcaceae bacterium]|nr:TonB-dependent receptor [Myxococcaceae bacterium]
MQRRWLAPLVLLGALSVGRGAGAQTPGEGPSVADRAEARRHFQLGVAAYTRGQWAPALEEFRSAYRLAPHPSVRVNMANCYDHLDRPSEAILNFEQFLAESPTAPEAQITQVEAQISALRTRVGELQITVVPFDAMGLAVTLDGQAISLGRPAHVAPGHHVIEALGEGFATAHREVDVAAGQAQVINLALARNAPAAVPVVEPPAVPAVA